MKLFSATVYFELPDNFDGSINDAFKEVIKYRENPDRPEPVNKNKERHAETTYSELFNIWLDNVETNPMLQRIYGTCFETSVALKEHLEKIEEAKKRDHRKLGKDLDLFSIHDEAGPGLVFYHPKGALLRMQIEDLVIF